MDTKSAGRFQAIVMAEGVRVLEYASNVAEIFASKSVISSESN